ncbi:MAG: hypothetical protein GY826_13640, partial [Fuerstiella sp.]|nr:hypothetical protein [Fuerstiella sp.]
MHLLWIPGVEIAELAIHGGWTVDRTRLNVPAPRSNDAVENQSQGVAPPTFMPPEQQEAGLDVWGFLRRRKGFLVLFAIIGTTLGYFNF